jgi:1-phosphofructokinase family hexose kinase
LILCLGLSPAWQHTLFFERFVFGEVNRAKRGVWCASGKVVNTAVALASLGVEHRMITFVGGHPETAFRENLAEANVSSELISVGSSTRVCTTLLVERNPTTELVEECGPLTADEVASFEAKTLRATEAAGAIVIAGSIPKGTDSSIWRRILERCSVPAVLDVRGSELLEALQAKPLLVKPNREELAATLNWDLTTDDDVLQAGRELCELGAKWVLVTHGTGPAILAGIDGGFRVHGVKVKTANPIGCGDTLAAAIAWRVTLGDGVPDAVRWGMAAAAANAETELPARFAPGRVEELVSSVKIEAL